MKEKKLSQMEVLDKVVKTHGKDLGLTQPDKMLLVTLCAHIYKDVSKEHYCDPTHALLESESIMKNRRTVQGIKTLMEKGYISTSRGRYKNRYVINVPLILEKHALWKESFNKTKPEQSAKTYLKQPDYVEDDYLDEPY